MQKWSKPTSEPYEIRFLLFDRFSNLCLANCLEPMRAANDFLSDAQFNWQFLTPSGETVHSSSDLPVMGLAAQEHCGECDYLFILASYGHLEHDIPATRALLRKLAPCAKTIIGFDTSPWLLASGGLLEGRKATVHYDVHDAFAERFLNIDAVFEPIIYDRPFITCAGAHSAYELTRELIAHKLGAALAVDIDNLFIRNASTANLGARAQGMPTSIVQKTLAEMQNNLETPLTLTQLSALVACPPKTLSRRFQAEIGASPGQIYRHLRLTHAHQLIENTKLSIAEIALRTGYESPAALSRAFKARFGRMPKSLRG